MAEDSVTKAAIALRDTAREFEDPVHFYVGGEAQRRWQKANPDRDFYEEAFDERDWELESWKILARAALAAQQDGALEPTETMLKAGAEAIGGYDTPFDRERAREVWRAMRAVEQGENK